MNTATALHSAVRTFHIDKSHSEVTFQVRHLLTKVRGRFSDFEGSIEFNADRPETSRVRLAIKASSIDTNQADRDAHLRSTDFFAVDEFPALTFESSGITATGDGTYQVSGTLTIRGVAKAVVLPVTHLGSATDPWGNEKLAFETETTINRKDFGLNWNAALEAGGFLVGDEVRISVSVQAVAGEGR
jgi:polyisoprenoid-binding protein YceI